jgi:hypothetical protein
MAASVPRWVAVGASAAAFYALVSRLPASTVDRMLKRHLGAHHSARFDLCSMVHSVVVSTLAAASIWLEAHADPPEPQRSYACAEPASPLSWLIPSIELGYALHDLSKAVWHKQMDFALHGVLVTTILLLLCGLGTAHHTSRISIVHLSTILLNLRRVDFGLAANRRVDVGFALSFLFLRCLMLPYWWLLFLAYGRDTPAREWGPCMHGGAVVALAAVGGLFMHALNFYWGGLILIKAVSRAKAGMRRPNAIGSNGFRLQHED